MSQSSATIAFLYINSWGQSQQLALCQQVFVLLPVSQLLLNNSEDQK